MVMEPIRHNERKCRQHQSRTVGDLRHQRASDNALTLMIINKTDQARNSSISLSNFTPGGPAEVYYYGPANLDAIIRAADQNVTPSGFNAQFPANTITLMVIPATSSKTAIFSDVPLDYWANSYIERLYNAGVTGGCVLSPLQYCPRSNSYPRSNGNLPAERHPQLTAILRPLWESAPAWAISPPIVGGRPRSKRLRAEGIASGCGNGNYCPETTVTRAQMAIFLLKAKHGSSYSPTATSSASTMCLLATGLISGSNNSPLKESPLAAAMETTALKPMSLAHKWRSF